MKAEYVLGGIYLSSVPVTLLIAVTATVLLHRLLSTFGVYRWVWHPALFDAALFVCLWAVLVLTRVSSLLEYLP
jgi:hypothetical protein